uniref:NADH dehydrogenase subunit 4L n=1 Tax=Syphacia muris TaxID=451379 RepID=A0A0N5A9X7_9BILA
MTTSTIILMAFWMNIMMRTKSFVLKFMGLSSFDNLF